MKKIRSIGERECSYMVLTRAFILTQSRISYYPWAAQIVPSQWLYEKKNAGERKGFKV